MGRADMAGPDRIFIDLRRAGSNELFVDPSWWQVLADTYGFRVEPNAVRDDAGEIVAALPYVEIDDITSSRLVSLPFCDFVEAPMTDLDWSRVIDPMLASGRTLRIDTVADHPATQDPRLHTDIDAIDYVIAVDRDPAELLQGFSTLPRRQIRRAERAGIKFRVGTTMDDLASFFDLHLGVRKYRHGLLAQPFAMFESIHANFFERGAGVVVLGEADGRVVGGCVVLTTPHATHYKFSASHPDYRREGVSHGAVFAALRYTGELGLELFDFGRSDLAHVGLVDFKRRFRPIERPLACHRAGPEPDTAVRSRLNELSRLYCDPNTPDELTALGGDHLYRFFA